MIVFYLNFGVIMYQKTAEELFKLLDKETKKKFNLNDANDLIQKDALVITKIFNLAAKSAPEEKKDNVLNSLNTLYQRAQKETKFQRLHQLITKYLPTKDKIEIDDPKNEGKKIEVEIPKTAEELEKLDPKILRAVGYHLNNKIREVLDIEKIRADPGAEENIDGNNKLKDAIEISVLTTDLTYDKEAKSTDKEAKSTKREEERKKREEEEEERKRREEEQKKQESGAVLKITTENGVHGKSDPSPSYEELTFKKPYYKDKTGKKVVKEVEGEKGFRFEVQQGTLSETQELIIKTPRVDEKGKDLNPPVYDLIVLDHNGQLKGSRKIISIGKDGKEVELDPDKDKANIGKTKLDETWLKSITPRGEAMVQVLSKNTPVVTQNPGDPFSPPASPGQSGQTKERDI